jgi:hypothetical protein
LTGVEARGSIGVSEKQRNEEKEMKYGIFLDDERNVEDAFWMSYGPDICWTVVRTFAGFVKAIRDNTETKYVVSFDHDLQDFKVNGDEYTGYDCVKFLVDFSIQHDKNLPEAYYHTQNPIGKTNMECYMNNAKKFMQQP